MSIVDEYKYLVSRAATIDNYIPKMNAINKYPEVYKNKALLLDLILTPARSGFYGGRINDEAVLFIREQLKENGSLEAMKNGTIIEFMLSQSEKENYVMFNGPTKKSYEKYNQSSKEKLSKIYVNQINEVLRTKNETLEDDKKYYQHCIKNSHFDEDFLYKYLEDDSKSEEILNTYRAFMQHQLKENKNPYHTRARHLESFAVKALKCGRKDIYLAMLSDMAKYTFPFNPIYNTRPKELRNSEHYSSVVSLIGHVNSLREYIEKNGIQEKVMQILDEYKKRPDVDFHINSNLLAKKRKALAQKIDEKYGTNFEQRGITKVGRKIENALSYICCGKDSGKNEY